MFEKSADEELENLKIKGCVLYALFIACGNKLSQNKMRDAISAVECLAEDKARAYARKYEDTCDLQESMTYEFLDFIQKEALYGDKL